MEGAVIMSICKECAWMIALLRGSDIGKGVGGTSGEI